MSFPTNAAFEKAVVADAESDVPRLAYADWLDENGDPDRAAFVRVQCRRPHVTPAAEEWIDLVEHEAELAEVLSRRHDLLPAFANRTAADDVLYFSASAFRALDHQPEFQRGFPFFVDDNNFRTLNPQKFTDRLVAAIAHVVERTTLRGLNLNNVPGDRYYAVFRHPAFDRFTGLALGLHGLESSNVVGILQMLVERPRAIAELGVYTDGLDAKAARVLHDTPNLPHVRQLTIQQFEAPERDIAKLLGGPLFANVERFRCKLYQPEAARAALKRLAKLPALHTLDLPDLADAAVPWLAAGKFPALARLRLEMPADVAEAGYLAAAKLPALRSLELVTSGMKNDAFMALLNGGWVERLRRLLVTDARVGNAGVRALAAHPAAKALRMLHLGDNPFGKVGLTALATGFPNLTTLDLASYRTRNIQPAEMAEFLSAVSLPRLRYLNLRNWPVGPAGAEALAANPAFASLRRLDLEGCAIADAGAEALFASPHLQGLVSLGLRDNELKALPDALADPGVMAGLRYVNVCDNKLPKATAKKLAGRVGVDGDW
jgi:uncharacterized protein (TIGR02996 family)